MRPKPETQAFRVARGEEDYHHWNWDGQKGGVRKTAIFAN
jgi:hypothetical protein